MSGEASTSQPRQVSGVVVRTSAAPGASSSERLLLRCSTAVAAGGALHTPALLLRSGLTVGGNVGANLRMHPATVVTAEFPKVCGCCLNTD